MTRQLLYCFILVGLLQLSPVFALAQTNQTLERFAIFVGSNHGGSNRLPLRYAQSDALSMAKVFEELGGLDHRNRFILTEPSVANMKRIFSQLNNQLHNTMDNDTRKELIFYFSGHSDETGLLLKDGKFKYSELRQKLTSLDLDVRIAILDSCESGAFTRLKGGSHGKALLLDGRTEAKGHVFLASSSEDEAAQEADNIGGSYFTHYLVSALRGAADISRDSKVTLNEAYQFAYDETLSRTASSKAGPQHAAYDIQLSGSGDIVLTDLRSTSATLLLTKGIEGRIFILDVGGKLIVEVNKALNKDMEIGLVSSTYDVIVKQNERFLKLRMELPKGKKIALDEQQLTRFTPDNSYFKGAGKSKFKSFLGGILKSGAEYKNEMSFGYYAQNLSFRGKNQNFPEMNYKGVYNGYTFLYRRQLNYNLKFGLRFYQTRAKGAITGVSSSLNLDLFSIKLYTGTFSTFAGLGVFMEQLSDYSNSLSRTLNSTNWSGLQYQFGFNYIYYRYLFELESFYRSDALDDYDKRTIADPVINFKVGYKY